MKKNKIGIVIVTLLLIMNYTTVIFAEESEPVEVPQDSEIQAIEPSVALENQSIAPAAMGDTIAQTFPDPKLAQTIATRYTGGDVNAILTQPLIDSINFLPASSKGITNLTGIGTLTALESLQLTSNSITTLPAEIGNLTNLKELYLDFNQITTLPSEIGNLTELTKLTLQRNQITALPSTIGNLTKLEQLYLGANQIATVPLEIGALSSLTDLGLSENKFVNFPVEVTNITSLEILRLNNNQITSVPPEVQNLINLTDLLLYTNNLVSLPAEIGNLPRIELLALDSNQLTDIPVEMGNLSTLNVLTITSNQLTSIPSEIGNLSSIVDLELSDNQLTLLPSEIGKLTTLEVLGISSNQLENLPSQIGALSSLNSLDASYNLLTSLPPEIGNFQKIEQLNFSNNQLTSLPSELDNLPKIPSEDDRYTLYRLELYNNLLPNNYQDAVNAMGFNFTLYYEDQRQLVLKNGITPFKIQSESDLNDIGLSDLVELSDAAPISPSHHFILTDYVDENGQSVALETYLKNGVVQKNGKVYAQVRSTGTGLFPNNSERAITLESIELDFQVNLYTLSFDLNGGTGTLPEPQSLLEGTLVKGPSNPTRDGYTFKGWNTVADGSGTTWDFTTTTMPANDVTLYAQWEKNTEPPVNPTNPNLPGNEMPKTGDSSNILWLSVLMSLAGVTLLNMFRKKKVQ